MSSRAVVLTGRGVVSPLGVGAGQYWEGLRAGRAAVGPMARLASLGLPVSRGAEIAPDLLAPHLGRLPRKQQKLYNRATLLAMLAGALAMEEAGLGPGAGDPERLGVVLGVNVLSWDLVSMAQYLAAAESPEAAGRLDMASANAFCMHQINPLDYSLKTLPNLAAGHLAIAHEARGACRALLEGPVGGARAIGQAAHMIAEGALDVALCGGTDAPLEGLIFASYWGSGLLASDAGDQAGFVAGEGSGLLVLEAAERARERGAAIHGEILGSAAAAGDGRLTPAADPEALGRRLARVIEEVLAEAGGMPDLIALHADGAPAHDDAEERALAAVFGPDAGGPRRLRLKRAHGDLGAASSPVELLGCSLAIEYGMLPAGVANGDGGGPGSPERALILSLGFFGECAAVMLGKPSRPAEGERAG